MERPSLIVGLMSGTSLDGVTAAVVRFHEDGEGRVTPELLAHVDRAYESATRARLAAALEGATPSEYTRLDFALGGWLADAAVAAIAESGVPREEIDAVASHGHTVWHEPPHGTWQFGQPAVIAERTGLDVIADFRVRDVAAGGQGDGLGLGRFHGCSPVGSWLRLEPHSPEHAPCRPPGGPPTARLPRRTRINVIRGRVDST